MLLCRYGRMSSGAEQWNMLAWCQNSTTCHRLLSCYMKTLPRTLPLKRGESSPILTKMPTPKEDMKEFYCNRFFVCIIRIYLIFLVRVISLSRSSKPLQAQDLIFIMVLSFCGLEEVCFLCFLTQLKITFSY